MRGVGLHGERGHCILVGAAVVIEPVQTESRAERDRDRLVRVVAARADVDGHIGAATALEDGRVLGIAQVARIADLDDQIRQCGRGRRELVRFPALIGVVVVEVEGVAHRDLREVSAIGP